MNRYWNCEDVPKHVHDEVILQRIKVCKKIGLDGQCELSRLNSFLEFAFIIGRSLLLNCARISDATILYASIRLVYHSFGLTVQLLLSNLFRTCINTGHMG